MNNLLATWGSGPARALGALLLALMITASSYAITSVTPMSNDKGTFVYISGVGYLKVLGGAPHKGEIQDFTYTDCGWLWCGGAVFRQGDATFWGTF